MAKRYPNKIDYIEFVEIYTNRVNQVYQFWTDEMQQKIARHNVDWNIPYNFKRYLDKSAKRFYNAYLEIPDGAKTCLDIGGFWGVYSLTLKDLGYTSVMTEAKKYYDDSFNPLFMFIESQGVKIIDIDPFQEQLESVFYDYISIMAVLEHISYSLKPFLHNVRQTLTSNGVIYIDVPNILYYFKRRDVILGKSPLPNIKSIYESEIPFIGHHHEYTLEELLYLGQIVEIKPINIFHFNYSIEMNFNFMMKHPIAAIVLSSFKNTREIIGVSFKLANKNTCVE
ncbi:MAG: hypothetical protein H6607_12445 [Flavobacteriales bacterium]|nr:hypothetical protein [Flavobacteriales bacterium]